jgi:formylglycine-generating enzyme required for sulfatase activity
MSDKSDPVKENSLIIRPSTGLVSLPEGSSPALSEIISRSLAHLQASSALAVHERRAGEEQEFEIAPGVKIVMCWIPPGEFLMGSPEDEVGRRDKETQHRVTITQGFWLAKTLTTQAQWEAVMGNNPSHFNGMNLPVESVSWNEISEPGGFMDKANRFAVAGEIFSLPTEAQWEYACRAGTTTALNNRKNLTTEYGMCLNLDEVAWYGMNSDRKTQPVGQKKANAYGLLDMQGNVWEWCMDWCEDYTTGAQVDPQGPISGSHRVNRGGGWYCYANGCRVATRSFFNPGGTVNSIGFRIACRSVPSSVQKCDDVGACIFDDGKFHPLPKGIWPVQ